MSVGVAVVGEGDPKPIFQFDEPCHGIGARWVHADLAVVIDGHEREGRIDHGVHDGDVELVDRVDRLPVRLGGAAERIHAQREAGAPDGRHVDDVLQIADIGQDEVVLVRAGGGDGLRVWQPSHPDVAVAQERVGPFLDPRRHVGVGRAAVRRVVLEAAVLGRVVRRRDDDAVRAMPGDATAVVHENRVRDDRCRGHALIALDDRVHPVGDEHLERRALSRLGQRVGVLPHVERAVDPLAAPVIADGLGDRGDMGLGERAGEWRTPVSAGAEDHALIRVPHVGLPRVVLPLEPGQVHQHLARGAVYPPAERSSRRSRRFSHRSRSYGTGHGLASQISAAYSAMVRSLENLPEAATFRIALRAHPFGSA